jgi:hypothetical protein
VQDSSLISISSYTYTYQALIGSAQDAVTRFCL